MFYFSLELRAKGVCKLSIEIIVKKVKYFLKKELD
jgi:hypothetical protein